MTAFTSEFAFGEKVHVDETGGIVATVVGFAFYTKGTQVQVSWWNNGVLVEHWVDEWRVRKMK
jgi:hypothetical protein